MNLLGMGRVVKSCRILVDSGLCASIERGHFAGVWKGCIQLAFRIVKNMTITVVL